MSTFNGLDLVLMLGLFLAVYGCAYWRGVAKSEYGRGYVAGNNHAISRLCQHLGMDPADQPVEVYDYEKDGL